MLKFRLIPGGVIGSEVTKMMGIGYASTEVAKEIAKKDN